MFEAGEGGIRRKLMLKKLIMKELNPNLPIGR
jgi:hypothetical protein